MSRKKSSGSSLKVIALDLIDRPGVIARESIDAGEIEELAKSIRERGLLQPIRVVERSGRYEIVSGDRRFLAHKRLDRKEIMAIVCVGTDQEVLLDRAVENIQRCDLTGLEEARVYDRLVRDFGMTFEQVAEKVGKSPGTVKRRLDILDMPESFQQAIHAKKVSVTVAEELMRCPDGGQREYYLAMAVDHGITKEVARLWVDDYLKALRTRSGAGGDGRGVSIPGHIPVSYMPCGLCESAVELGKTVDLRICPDCWKRLCEVMESV